MARPPQKKKSPVPTAPEPSDPQRPPDPSPIAYDPALPRKMTPQWVAAMLVDVTAHLMSAIDKAARIREPLDRIADAAESAALARAPTARSRLLAILKSPLTVVVLLGLALTVPYFVHRVWSARLIGDVSYMRPADSAELYLRGVRYRATRELIEQRLASAEPEPIRKYSVEIDRRRFPVKQAVAVGFAAPRSDFETDQAIRVLKKLGFQIDEQPR